MHSWYTLITLLKVPTCQLRIWMSWSHSVRSLLTYPPLGSISAVSRVRSSILREESSFGGSVRAHFPEQRLVIEPNPPPHLKKGGWTQASPHFLHFLTKATWQPSSKDKTKTIIISVNPLRLWIIFSVAEMWRRLGLIIPRPVWWKVRDQKCS